MEEHPQHIAISFQVGTINRPQIKIQRRVCRFISAISRKTSEIMCTHIDLQCCSQRICIKTMRHMPHATTQKGRKNPCTANQILILLADGIKPGMKMRRYLLNTGNADIRRQMGIECSHPVIHTKAARFRCIHVEALRVRMNACISAPTSRNTHWFLKNPPNCSLDGILNRLDTALALPAAIRLAIVRASEQKPGHGSLLNKHRSSLIQRTAAGIIKT